jgi:hypothetical protein
LLWDVLRIEGKNCLKPGDEHAFAWDVRYQEKQKARSGFELHPKSWAPN